MSHLPEFGVTTYNRIKTKKGGKQGQWFSLKKKKVLVWDRVIKHKQTAQRLRWWARFCPPLLCLNKKDRHGVTSGAESPKKLEVRKEENWGIKRKYGPMALLVLKVWQTCKSHTWSIQSCFTLGKQRSICLWAKFFVTIEVKHSFPTFPNVCPGWHVPLGLHQ